MAMRSTRDLSSSRQRGSSSPCACVARNAAPGEINAQSVGAAFAMALLAILNGLTLATACLAVFAEAMARELSWGRAGIGGGARCAQLGLASAATLIGWLADRYGARAVLLPSVILSGAGIICLSITAAIPALFFGCLFVIGSCSAALFLCGGKVISSWF